MSKPYDDFRAVVRYVDGDPEELDIAFDIRAGIIADAYLGERSNKYCEPNRREMVYQERQEGS